MDNFFASLQDDGLLRDALNMAGAENRILLFCSPDLRVASLTRGAAAALHIKQFTPLSLLLPDSALESLRLCVSAGAGTAQSVLIDGVPYRMDVQGEGNGLLIAFTPEGAQSTTTLQAYLGERERAALATIIGSTGLLAQTDDPEVRQRLTCQIRKSSLQMYRTLEHARALTSAPDEFRQPEMHAGDLAALCRETAKQVRARGPSGVSVHALLPDQATAVFDETLVRQALCNLLVNAVLAPDVSSVTLSLRTDEQYLTLSVTDDGRGLPPEVLGGLLEGWQHVQPMEERLATAAARQSWGLGLPLTRQIAGLHDGVLLMQPGSPKGTVFQLVLSARLSPLFTLGQPPLTVTDGFDPFEVALSPL